MYINVVLYKEINITINIQCVYCIVIFNQTRWRIAKLAQICCRSMANKICNMKQVIWAHTYLGLSGYKIRSAMWYNNSIFLSTCISQSKSA